MSVKRPIQDLLPNENVVDLVPSPDENQGGRRRLNLFKGRTLSHQNLAQEQAYRDTHLAHLGRQRSPGVITGLEATLSLRADGTGDRPSPLQRDLLVIQAGDGLSRRGQEVNLVTGQSVLLGNLPVYTPSNVLGSGVTGGTDLIPLRSLVEQNQPLPPVGIVLLQPITAASAGVDVSSDPCAIDVESRAFDNLQRIDGSRLIFYAWPENDLALPVLSTDSSDLAGVNRWRSQLAYSIFRRELEGPLPWESLGVPIALIGFDASWQALFADRAAVVRQGGRALHRPSLMPLSGTPFLWQARIEQFAEQLASLGEVSSEDLGDYFAWLPPVGTLPNDAIKNLSLPNLDPPSPRQQLFFPSGYRVEAAPIPTSQIDLVFHESASLRPFDTVSNDRSNQVKLLVPVPDDLYDPDLLKVEQLDSIFTETLTRFIDRRADQLNRRQIVRDRITQLQLAINGTPPRFPTPDPNQLESSEKIQPEAPFPNLDVHQSTLASGIHEHGFNNTADATQGIALANGDRIITHVHLDDSNPPAEVMLTFRLGNNSEHRAYWGALNSRIERGVANTGSRRRLGALPTTGEWIRLEVPIAAVDLADGNLLTGMDFTLYGGQAAWGPTSRLRQDAAIPDPVWVTSARVAAATTRLEAAESWVWLTDAEQRSLFESRFGITLTPNQTSRIESLEDLKNALRENSPIDLDAVRIKQLETDDGANQLAALLATLPGDSPVKADAQRRTLTIRGVLSTQERDRLLSLAANSPAAVRTVYSNAIVALFAQSQNNNILAQLDTKGLGDFIDQLEREVNRGNDKIEFGFLQVRTDMFRVRQFVLGEEDASRLSVSPALNAIAKRDSAATAKADLSNFFDELKSTLPDPTEPPSTPVVPTPDTFITATLAPGAATVLRTPGAASETDETSRIDTPTDTLVTLETARRDTGSAFSFNTLNAPTPSASLEEPMALERSNIVFNPVTQPILIDSPTERFQPISVPSAPAPGAISAPISVLQPPLQIGQPVTVQPIATTATPSTSIVNLLSQPNKKVFSGAPASTIVEQSPAVGKTYPNISIAERLQQPPAIETRNYALSGRVSVINDLAATNLFKDIVLPGSLDATIGQVQNKPGDINADPDGIGANADEAAFFSSSIRVLDETVTTLRLAEGRLADYRASITQARRTLKQLQALATQGEQRLGVIESDLAEARHDVAAARSLIAEEQQRLDQLNQKRQAILATQVNLLLYHRPRTLGPDTDLPQQTLLPAVQSPGRPACLDRPWILPAALQAATDLLRQAPINWFGELPPLLNRLDRPQPLLDLLQISAVDAARPVVKAATPRFALAQSGPRAGTFTQAVSLAYSAQQQAITQARTTALGQLNISTLAERSWIQIRDRATLTLTLGDLMSGKHNNSRLTSAAAKEFTDISRALACLHNGFSAVSAAIRLVWAERLSQYDQPIRLRNLSSLPRWNDLEDLNKRELQAVADWLYQRINLNQPSAQSLIDDLVRICVLLASAAPVDQIIAGRIINPAPVKPGGNISIAINPDLVHIGMTVSLFGNNNNVIAEGIVEDLAADLATTRIVSTAEPTVQLATNTKARFYRPL